MSVYSLQFELQGLSFSARAVLATATALTYEYGDEDLAVRVLRECLGLSAEAWELAYEELHEAGHLFRVPDRYGNIDLVCLSSSFDILSKAMGAGGRPTSREWKELRDLTFAEHGRRCTYCGTLDGPFVVDHIVAVSKGGSNHWRNLVPACGPCNSMKGSKSWAEWYPIMQGLRK